METPCRQAGHYRINPAQQTPLKRPLPPFMPKTAFITILTLLIALNALNVRAQTGDSGLQDQKKNLEAVRQRIEKLRKELSGNESARQKAQEEVRQSEKQMLLLQRELDELAGKRSRLEQTLNGLRIQATELSHRVSAQQAQLEQTLYQHYVSGTPDPVQNLLNGGDPAQVERENYYLTLLAQNHKHLISNLRADLLAKQKVAAEVKTKTEELNGLLGQQKLKHAELTKQRDRRQELVAALSGKVEKQKQQITSLQQDEKRLSQLIDRLIEQIAKRERERRAAAARANSGNQTHKPIADDKKPALSGLTANNKMPVQGPIVGRFGSRREDGGTWKGILIRANQGTPVKSIATGHVVFSEWMRGFGNLLILDHGDGYLSIYGHNDQLLKKVGDTAKSGESVATVGSNAGGQESGLYFEIRHQGRPLDPLKWANAR